MRPAFHGRAGIGHVGGKPVFEVGNAARISLGRWNRRVDKWSLGFRVWLDAHDGLDSAQVATVLAEIAEPGSKMQWIWNRDHLAIRWAGIPGDGPRWSEEWRTTTTFIQGRLKHWSHVALVSDSTSLRFYIDGIAVGMQESRSKDGIENAMISLGPGSAPQVLARYEDVTLFDRDLSEDEIRTLAEFRRGDYAALFFRPTTAARLWSYGLPVFLTTGLVLIAVSVRRAFAASLAMFLRQAAAPQFRWIWIMLLTELLVTGWISWMIECEGERLDSQQFHQEAQRFAGKLDADLRRIGDLTQATRDWVSTQTNLNQNSWQLWAASRSVESDYPGFLGIGFALPVTSQWLGAFEAVLSERHGFPFRVWSETNGPNTVHPERLGGDTGLAVAVYQPWRLAPQLWLSNHTILGRDLLAMSESAARRAIQPEPLRIESAIGNGRLVSSGVVEIAPASWYGHRIRGIRIYAPRIQTAVGDSGPIPNYVWGSGPSIFGVAFTSIDLSRWLIEALKAAPPHLGVRVWTGDSHEDRHDLAFDSSVPLPETHFRSSARFTTTEELPCFQHVLWLDFWSTERFEAGSRWMWPWISAAVGGVFALLGTSILWVQVRARARETRISERLRAANAELLALQREREQLSRNLHDGTIQSLYAVGLHLQYAHRHLGDPDPRSSHGIAEGQRLVQEAIVELRESLLSLKDEQLRRRTFSQTAKELLERFRKGMPISTELSVETAAESLPPPVVIQLINVTREALSNAVRHGGPQRIQISLKRNTEPTANPDLPGECWTLEIRDDGRGFDANSRSYSGFGLLTMRERAAELGGSLAIESSPGQGTRLRVNFTLPKEGLSSTKR